MSELSRLGRSLGQVIHIVDELVKRKIRFTAIKESIHFEGKQDLQTKVMVALFGLRRGRERLYLRAHTRRIGIGPRQGPKDIFTPIWSEPWVGAGQQISCMRAQGAATGKKMNALSVIFPYRLEGVWVFDDAATGLVREPFISGADTILDVLAEHIPNAADGFKIVFSAGPFPGYTARFVWTRAEYEGNWYRWPERQMEGWLCPALLKYFESSPKEIFVQASAKSP